MTKLIPAVFEHGTLKLISPLKLPEHQKVLIAITLNNDETPSLLISKLAENSASFSFLNNLGEDIYSVTDGEAID